MTKTEKIQKLIDEIGFDETCERLQLKSYDIIRLFRLPIDSRYVKILLSELFEDDKLPKQYEEFTIMNFDTENHTVTWESYFGDAMISPFLDDVEIIDIWLFKYRSETTDKGYYHNDIPKRYGKLKSEGEFNNLEEFLVWVRDFYFPECAKTIRRLIKENNEILD